MPDENIANSNPTTEPTKPKGQQNKIIPIIVGLIVVAVIGYGVWQSQNKKSSEPTGEKSSITSSETTSSETESAEEPATSTKPETPSSSATPVDNGTELLYQQLTSVGTWIQSYYGDMDDRHHTATLVFKSRTLCGYSTDSTTEMVYEYTIKGNIITLTNPAAPKASYKLSIGLPTEQHLYYTLNIIEEQGSLYWNTGEYQGTVY